MPLARPGVKGKSSCKKRARWLGGKHNGKRCRVGKTGKKLGHRTGGGGAQRAFFSEKLSGQSVKDEVTREKLFEEISGEYRWLLAAGTLDDHFKKRGRDGTVQHQCSGHAFGESRRKKPNISAIDHTFGDIDAAAGELEHAGIIMSVAQAARRVLRDLDAPAAGDDHAAAVRAVADLRESSEKRLLGCDDPVFKGTSAGEGVRQVSHAPSDLDLEVFHVVPPAPEVARRFMMKSGHGGVRGPQSGVQAAEALLKAWTDRHALVCHDPLHVQKIQKKRVNESKGSLSAMSVCARVGRCICNDAHQLCRAALVTQIRSMLTKGSKGRKFDEASQPVIRVFSVHGPLDRHYSKF